jgi:glycosyltransferase involved in cell wall biosynthesis
MLNLFSRYDKRLIQKLDKVMIPNHYLKEIMDRYYGIDTEVVRISGVDTEHFVPLNNQDEIRAELAKKFGIPVDAQLILSASILMWHRRFEDGIAAVAALNKQGGNMHYLIVGSSRSNPDYKQHLENYIKTLGAEKYVHLLDTYIADKQLLNLYNACDVFLFPNQNQTWGLAPLEAMSVGKPVIVTKGAGVHEVLKDGKTAFIVDQRDTVAMAEKLQILLSDDKLRRQIAAQGSAFVRENMTWDKCAGRLVQFFERLRS